MISKKDIAIFAGLTYVFAAWFTFLIPWKLFPDPDAFYHAIMAQMTWLHGPVSKFPWLDLTSLGQHFSDQHYLLHVIEGPFVQIFGLMNGSRISSVTFAVICMLGLTAVFFTLRLRPYWLWPLLLITTSPFCMRLVQGKASPLAILLWMVGIAACLKIMTTISVIPAPLMSSSGEVRRRPGDPLPSNKERFTYSLDSRFFAFNAIHGNDKNKIGITKWLTVWQWRICLFVCSVLFALTHGGWIILPGSIFLLLVGQAAFAHVDGQLVWKQAIKQVSWPLLAVSLLGVVVGLILHPGTIELLRVLYIQVIKIAILTPRQLSMGNEWGAATVGDSLGMSAIFGVLLVLVIAGMFVAPKKDLDRKYSYIVFLCAPLVAALFMLSLKSLRYTEYFQPLFCLWIASLMQWTDWRKLQQELKLGNGRLGMVFLPAIIFFCLFVVTFNNVFSAYSSLHNSNMFRDSLYIIPMKAISDAAQPGDRVYHAQWDEFPLLFLRDQRLRYVSGLDPTFLYEASTTLALDYEDLSFRAASSTREKAWSYIHNRVGAKFLIIDKERWKDLVKLIDSDSRYVRMAEGDGGVAYRVSEVDSIAPSSPSLFSPVGGKRDMR